MSATRRPRDDQGGSASVLVVALIAVLGLVTLGACAAGALFVGQRAAQGAADLAALAGAEVLVSGGDACAAAQEIAQANRAELAACAVSGRDVEIEVSVRGPTLMGKRTDLRARARAGPR